MLAAALAKNSDTNDQLILDIKKLINDLCFLGQQHSIAIKGFSDRGLNKLASTPEYKLQEIYNNLKSYYFNCASISKNGISLRDSKHFVAHAMRSLNMQVSDSFLNTLDSNDVIEFYDVNSIQFFRNLSFFEYTYYSLSDIISHEWPELYARSNVITQKIQESVAITLAEEPSLKTVEVQSHLMKQILTDPVRILEISFKYMAPVYRKGHVGPYGFVISCGVKDMAAEIEESQIDFI